MPSPSYSWNSTGVPSLRRALTLLSMMAGGAITSSRPTATNVGGSAEA